MENGLNAAAVGERIDLTRVSLSLVSWRMKYAEALNRRLPNEMVVVATQP